MEKRISVCMATYNGGRYIKEQLDSILSQLGDHDELLISDDGSTDNTLDIIKSYDDPRITVYVNSFHNYNLNFEFVLGKATGDYIFLSDQDDVWMSEKVELMKKELEQHNLANCDCYIVDADLNIIANSFLSKPVGRRGGFWNNFVVNNYLGCCMAFRKEILDKALPFPRRTICHDGWLGLVGEAFGSPVFMKQPLIKYRRHSSNASQTTKGSTLSLREKIGYRWRMFARIVKLKIGR